MVFRKAILVCVASCVFPALAYSLQPCSQDLCSSKDSDPISCVETVCDGNTKEENGTPFTCRWVRQNPHPCTFVIIDNSI